MPRGTVKKHVYGKAAAAYAAKARKASRTSHRDVPRVTNIRTGGYNGLEKKFTDQDRATASTATTWASSEIDPLGTNTLCSIDQGNGNTQRLGRTANVVSLNIRGTATLVAQESTTAPTAVRWIRLCLVLDKQTNSAQLAGENVFASVGASLEIQSFRNLEYVERFEVLADKTIFFPSASINEGSINLFSRAAQIKKFSMAYKWKDGLKHIYDGTSGLVGDLTGNSLHLIATASNSEVLVNYTCRCRFYG